MISDMFETVVPGRGRPGTHNHQAVLLFCTWSLYSFSGNNGAPRPYGFPGSKAVDDEMI